MALRAMRRGLDALARLHSTAGPQQVHGDVGRKGKCKCAGSICAVGQLTTSVTWLGLSCGKPTEVTVCIVLCAMAPSAAHTPTQARFVSTVTSPLTVTPGAMPRRHGNVGAAGSPARRPQLPHGCNRGAVRRSADAGWRLARPLTQPRFISGVGPRDGRQGRVRHAARW